MSLITQQTLLQARSDRDDALHRLSVGDDTAHVRQLLNGATKRIAKLEKQLADENAAAAASAKQRADAAAKAADSKKSSRGGDGDRAPRGERPPLPKDMELSCVDCSCPFTFTGKDQLFFTKNSWNAPSRCTDCRDAKKSAKPSGMDLTCGDCENTFFFTDAKARVFEENGWEQPKRCSDCSKAHKSMAPLTIKCEGCPKNFGFSVKAQKDFKLKGWTAPKRCFDCRKSKSDGASVKTGSTKAGV